jgi:hypothetical protein
VKSTDGRLDRLYPALTAKERAILVLRAWKEGGEEDPLVRRTMPSQQGPEFNDYIGLMNVVNGDLATYILLLHSVVANLCTKHGWLLTLGLWRGNAMNLSAYIFFHTKEPITESQHVRRLQEARSKNVPVRELAEIVVERCEDWDEADLDSHFDDGEPVVTDEAWERVQREKEREIARLVRGGVIKGTGKGTRLRANAGSFYDWLGEPVPVAPDWGVSFEVSPDAEGDNVGWLRRRREEAQEATGQAPGGAWLDSGPDGDHSEEVGKGSRLGQVEAALQDSLRGGIEDCWLVLRAVELLVEEVTRRFDGEDPLLSRARTLLDDARNELTDLNEQAERWHGGPLKLREPDEETLSHVRGIVDRENR